MNKNIIFTALIVCVLVIGIYSVRSIFKSSNQPNENSLIAQDQRLKSPCPGQTVIAEMDDDQLPNALPKGNKYKLFPNWYACHDVKAGDLVLLQFSEALPPVIRKVAGAPGDSYKLIQNKTQKNWDIEIDGKKLMDPSGKPHAFGGEHPSLIGLYDKALEGKLRAQAVLVFTETSFGVKDSGTLGVVNSNDFLGKIEAE